jgi:hypothetical protein
MKLKINFQKEKLGLYSEKRINKIWNNPPKIRGLDRSEIVKDGTKKVLRIKHLKGGYGAGGGGASWKLIFDKPYEQIYLQYKIKFDKNFDFRLGGKLPGVYGGSVAQGGEYTEDGFSSRIMWREKGEMHQYEYYPTKDPSGFGKAYYWHNLQSKKLEKLQFKKGKWHTVKMKIQLNTFTTKKGKLSSYKGNGYVIGWFDKKLALHQDVNYRPKYTCQVNNSEKVKYPFSIDNFTFASFFGGDESFAPFKDEYIYYDDFIISDKDI